MSQPMRRKSTMVLAFLAAASPGCVTACGGAAPPQPSSAASAVSMRASSASSPAEPEPAPAATPSETLAEADRAYDSQLAASRGDRFEVDRQVAVLRQAVLLYTQFLERAEGRPELEPAVRKSRERIADAQQTIEFLLSQASAGASR